MSKVTAKYQVTIPVKVRKEMGIVPGAEVDIKKEGHKYVLVVDPIETIRTKWQGKFKDKQTTMEYIEDYFANYLMDPQLTENETYRYSSRIHHPMPKGGTQLERTIQVLKETPLTNQAVVEIGTPEDYDICYGNDGNFDPPCLRLHSGS